MGAYYNDNDPFAAAWLRELIKARLLPQGDVDERSISSVAGDDLRGYVQCHFFAGIGGWPYALRLAGWPDDEPVWTGSCPCQPFSVAGAGKGHADERHLWPEFRRLIAECRPERVFGEQVDSADGWLWLAGVQVDLEAEAYRVGAAGLCAGGVGAPHDRARIYWVADTDRGRREQRDAAERGVPEPDAHVPDRGVGDAFSQRGCSGEPWRGNAEDAGLAGKAGFWADAGTVLCGDGNQRRIPLEPALFPLADGLSSGRVGTLRGAGNAIVPAVAAEFIRAYREVSGQ